MISRTRNVSAQTEDKTRIVACGVSLGTLVTEAKASPILSTLMFISL